MDTDEKLAEAKLKQRKGDMVDAMEEAGIPIGSQQPTEYAKAAKTIVEKMHAPQDMHEQQLHSNIPKTILPNIMMLTGIENAMRELVESDYELIDKDKEKITLFREIVTVDPATKKPLITQSKYRTMSLKGYHETQYWANFWHGFTGNLLEELPAVEGGRAKDAVAEISAITNSDRALLEAQNNQSAGLIRRVWNGVRGK